MTYLDESPMAAQARAVGPLLRKIAGLPDDLTLPADELRDGMIIRVAGDFAELLGRKANGDLILRDAISDWTYTPTCGERFLWDEGTR